MPEGSKVRFQIALDRAPASARIAWTPAGSKTPTVLPLAVEGNQLTGDLPPLAKDVRYEVIAIASDGMKLDPTRFLIKVQPDEKPTIKFVKPAESLAATPTTEVPVKVVAGDDYGVAKVGMSYQVGDGPEESLYLDEPEGPAPDGRGAGDALPGEAPAHLCRQPELPRLRRGQPRPRPPEGQHRASVHRHPPLQAGLPDRRRGRRRATARRSRWRS